MYISLKEFVGLRVFDSVVEHRPVFLRIAIVSTAC